MGWLIKCTDPDCGHETWVKNIVDLIADHRGARGWFLCSSCRKHGHIKKEFKLQELGEVWKPYLRGVIPLGKSGETYQPFVFLLSHTPSSKVTDLWFSYYKDLRSSSGGQLKLGYGPGGPPVLCKVKFLHLLSQLVATRYLTKRAVLSAVGKSRR
jgi:hypothetical protein